MLVGNVTICTDCANVKAWPEGGVEVSEIIGLAVAVMVVVPRVNETWYKNGSGVTPLMFLGTTMTANGGHQYACC
jgi:hypothetical protein